MSGMIPGVGVPHRRRPNHHSHSHSHSHSHPPHTPYDGDHRHTSMQLSPTAMSARQRLEKRLRPRFVFFLLFFSALSTNINLFHFVILISDSFYPYDHRSSCNLNQQIGDGGLNPRTETMDDDNCNNNNKKLSLKFTRMMRPWSFPSHRKVNPF
uniref:Uncharacterized protein n=1 Tax=Cannabis sativa TaxID=3483 RepID=A0A803R8G4_CANSA